MSMRTLLQKLGLKKTADAGTASAPSRLEKMTGALHLSLESIEKAGLSDDEKVLMVEETMGQFRAAVLAKGDKVPKVKEEGVEEDDDEFADEEDDGDDDPFSEDDDEDDTETLDEEDEDMADEKEKVAKMESEITSLTKRLTDAEARAEEAAARVTKFEQAETDRQILAKAEKMVAGTAVAVEQAVTLLKSGGEEGEKALAAILASTRSATADAQIFKELGSAAGVTVDGSVKGFADEIRKSDPKLTEEQAIAKAYRDHPELYDAAVSR